MKNSTGEVPLFGNWCWHCNSSIIDGQPKRELMHRSGKLVEIHKSCTKSYVIGIIKYWFGR